MAERRVAEASTSAPKASRRRISHISKACNGCRRRKMKCDGVAPSCAICKVYKEECVYNPEADGRRSTPKAYVSALEERVRVLERTLRSHGLDTGSGAGSVSGEVKIEREESLSVDAGLDRLKLDEATGELLEYGPTSVFHGTEESPSSHASPGGGGALERTALLRPRPVVLPQLSCPELDSATHEKILMLFFDYFNCQCFWVDEKRFRRDLLASPPNEGSVIRARRTPYYSPLLHNILLAVGVSFLEIDSGVREQLGIAFSKRAKDLLEEEAEAPMLSTISGLLLIGTYHASVARQNLGFIYAGIGLRLVQALGLGTNCSYWVTNGSITDETRQARYSLFYSSYILDKVWSTYVGRGASLCIANHDVPVPSPDPEEDNILWQPIIHTPRGQFDPQVNQAAIDLSDAIASANAEPVKGWRSTTWVWTCKLSIIAERVLGTVYSIGFSTASKNVRHIVSELDVSLEKWFESLPEPLRLPATSDNRTTPSHILSLHAFHRFILILLHRPWFAQIGRVDPLPETSLSSIGKCERAAVNVLTILAQFRRCPGLRYCPITLSQVAFSAGTVHLLSATHCASKTSKKFKTSIDAVQQCITALKEMGESRRCSAVSAATLGRLLDEYYTPPSRPPSPPPQQQHTISHVDLSRMLQDPSVAEQLLRLGWAPPGPSSGPATSASGASASPSSMHHTPFHNQGDTSTPPNQGPVDWSLFGHLQPPPATPAPMPPPQQHHQHHSQHPHQHQHMAGQFGAGHPPANQHSVSICDVLYAGTPGPGFPSGNSWTWAFGADGGATGDVPQGPSTGGSGQ